MATDFDFGFTLVDEADLDVSKELASATATSTSAQDKLDTLYNAITPLLNNLKANPEREYIKWPNRVDKVEAFETHIQKIYKG
jgi:hypothetical protein|tara:strand:- start:149 stop:397 length:249 start_codon:yes stop_codon:yes gene_type:complete